MKINPSHISKTGNEGKFSNGQGRFTFHPLDPNANKRLRKVSPLLDEAKDACQRLGGCAEIAEGYFIVNSNKFTIKEK